MRRRLMGLFVLALLFVPAPAGAQSTDQATAQAVLAWLNRYEPVRDRLLASSQRIAAAFSNTTNTSEQLAACQAELALLDEASALGTVPDVVSQTHWGEYLRLRRQAMQDCVQGASPPNPTLLNRSADNTRRATAELNIFTARIQEIARAARGSVSTPVTAVPSVTTPAATASEPTAICVDGTYSYSQNRSGTCSGHGGVSQFLGTLAAQGGPCPQEGCRAVAGSPAVTPVTATPVASSPTLSQVSPQPSFTPAIQQERIVGRPAITGAPVRHAATLGFGSLLIGWIVLAMGRTLSRT